MHELPSGNCASDFSFKVGEESVSIMSSASNYFLFAFCFGFVSEKKSLGSEKKKKKGGRGMSVGKPTFFSLKKNLLAWLYLPVECRPPALFLKYALNLTVTEGGK